MWGFLLYVATTIWFSFVLENGDWVGLFQTYWIYLGIRFLARHQRKNNYYLKKVWKILNKKLLSLYQETKTNKTTIL